MLGSAAHQRDLGHSREVGGEEAADDSAADHPHVHGVPPARMVASFAESMFPPETTQTTFPEPPFSASAAASARAPAPSVTTRDRSASRRTAAAVSSTETAAAPPTRPRGSPHDSGCRPAKPA